MRHVMIVFKRNWKCTKIKKCFNMEAAKNNVDNTGYIQKCKINSTFQKLCVAQQKNEKKLTGRYVILHYFSINKKKFVFLKN